jgi:hypothetical protein
MGQIKISQLTPKDAPLSDTDLFVIAEETSDDYESKSITGHEVLATARTGMQRELISGENIKTINSTSLLGSGNIAIQMNPRLLAFSGKNGTQTSGTTITVCHSILIPANTFTNNNILQVVFRMLRQSGNLGQIYGRIYFNTANTLTGATLFNTNFTMNGGGTQFLGLVERNFSYDGTNLTSFSNASFSEYTTGAVSNVAFNATVDNYVLLTMQCQNLADIANINLFKIFTYA